MIKRYLLLGAGFVLLLLAFIGAILPVLPTTPFVLLASACFASASPRLYKWLSTTKFFGEFITNYNTNAGVSRKNKVKALVFLYFSLGLSAVLSDLLHVRLILLAVAVGVTIHLVMLKTKP
jgi:uncharacterized membrane protein YbaN (DUF454 family)